MPPLFFHFFFSKCLGGNKNPRRGKLKKNNNNAQVAIDVRWSFFFFFLNCSMTTFGHAPGKGEVFIARYTPALFFCIKTQLADSIFTLLMSLVQSCSCPLGSFHRCPRGCWDTARAFEGQPLKSDAAKSSCGGLGGLDTQREPLGRQRHALLSLLTGGLDSLPPARTCDTFRENGQTSRDMLPRAG